MKKAMWIMLSLLFLSGSNVMWAQESEEEGGVGIETSIDVTSRYLWRGIDLNHKKPTIQPSVTYSPAFIKGLSLNAWTYIGFGKKKYNDPDEIDDVKTTIDEVDLTLTYEKELIAEKLTGSVSLINYNYISDWMSDEGDNKNDFEVNAALYYTAMANEKMSIVPYISYYRGLDKGESKGIAANYLEFGAAYSYIINEQWSVSPTLNTAWTDQYEIDKKFSYVALSVPATYASGAWSLTPYLNVVKPLEDLNADNKKLVLWGGLNFTYGF